MGANASALPIKISVSSPSDWTEFCDDVPTIEFYVTVHVNTAGVAIGPKCHAKAPMTWCSGPAVDLVVEGFGWCTSISVGLQYSIGAMIAATGDALPKHRHDGGGKFSRL